MTKKEKHHQQRKVARAVAVVRVNLDTLRGMMRALQEKSPLVMAVKVVTLRADAHRRTVALLFPPEDTP